MGGWVLREILLRIFFIRNSESQNPKNPGVHFFKKDEPPRFSREGAPPAERGAGKVLLGSRQVRMGQKCVPNPMETFPDPKEIKNPKIPENSENPPSPKAGVCSTGGLLFT